MQETRNSWASTASREPTAAARPGPARRGERDLVCGRGLRQDRRGPLRGGPALGEQPADGLLYPVGRVAGVEPVAVPGEFAGRKDLREPGRGLVGGLRREGLGQLRKAVGVYEVVGEPAQQPAGRADRCAAAAESPAERAEVKALQAASMALFAEWLAARAAPLAALAAALALFAHFWASSDVACVGGSLGSVGGVALCLLGDVGGCGDRCRMADAWLAESWSSCAVLKHRASTNCSFIQAGQARVTSPKAFV